MKLKKIVAAVAAAAVAVSMMAVSAFAATVEIDSEYPGSWTSSGKGIKKADLEAVGGDVKIVLTVETRNLANTADQFLVNPIDYDNGWVSQTVDHITSDTITAKTDGWICVRESDTTLEFVLAQDAIAALGDDGLCFSVQNVIVKSADGPQGALNLVDDAAGKAYCFSSADDAAAPAEEAAADTAAETTEAPAADTTTTAAATGNTAAAAIASVMAVAGVAAIAAKKRK